MAKTPNRSKIEPESPAAENARLRKELREALDQQQATAEILRTIAGSPAEAERALDAIAQITARLFGASSVNVRRVDGDLLRFVGGAGPAVERVRGVVTDAQKLTPVSLPGAAIAEKRQIHVPDLDHLDPRIAHWPGFAPARLAGTRTIVATPLMREGLAIGAMMVHRDELKPFTEKELAQLANFADQAVIAIENARLLDELNAHMRDLSESLEQQTASAEILRAIASSPGEPKRVLDIIADTALRLLQAQGASITRMDGGNVERIAAAGVNTASVLRRLDRSSPSGRAAIDKRMVHIKDILQQADEYPGSPAFSESTPLRSILATPLLREGESIGAISVQRSEVRPYSAKEQDLLRSFADQAVIAIENARLLNELNAHMRDLSESLERQTASAEILRAIASTPGEVERVLDTIANTAQRLFGAFGTVITRIDGEAFHQAASVGSSAEVFRDWVTGLPIDRGSIHGRAVLERRTIHIEDMQAERAQFPTRPRDRENLAIRTIAAIPLMREGEAIGTIAIARGAVQPFTDKELELAQSFADQSVIAIENARLLDELEDWNKNLEARVSQQVSELERMGQLRRFLSPQIADLVSSGSAALLESHRREITVVYCDMRGFTAFAESSEPEEVMGVMGEYHAALGALIHEYEGTLERFVGDGLMVLFNDPVPCPDPAARAVKMAVAMRERFATLSKKWSTHGHDLGFGIGIAQGYATLGRIGFEGRFDYGSVGTVSNLGARLCAEAQDGQILVSRQVQAAVDDIAACEPIGELTLKGLRRPVATYNVVGLKG